MDKRVVELSKAAMTAAVNHLETCEKGMIVHTLQEQVPSDAPGGDRGDREAPALGREVAKKLVTFITQSMERESALLQPNPQVFMNDPYGLLDLIRDEAKLKPEEIDAWMVEAQPGKKL
jgi:hypothetical protein